VATQRGGRARDDHGWPRWLHCAPVLAGRPRGQGGRRRRGTSPRRGEPPGGRAGQELGGFGIRCNAVAPLCVEPTGLFPNPGLIALAERESGSFAEWVRGQIPLGRAQSADETAAVISFLCSRDASYVSGVTIPVCGGAAS